MAEKTPVFGRVVFGQRGDTVRSVTIIAEFFRGLFVHFQEFCVVIIVGQMFGRFFRCVPEKYEKAGADDNKDQVVNNNVFSL